MPLPTTRTRLPPFDHSPSLPPVRLPRCDLDAAAVRAGRGDEAAAGLVLQALSALLWRFVRRIVRSRPKLARHAEDLRAALDMFVLRSMPRYKPGQGAATTYFGSIAHWQLSNLARDLDGDAVRIPRWAPRDTEEARRAMRPSVSVLSEWSDVEAGGEPGVAVVDRRRPERNSDAALDVEARLARLAPRSRRVIAQRFGLDGRRPRTLDEIARELGISRQRVQRLEVKALARMRASVARGAS